ncbi:UNVERIFIED_CONTAM: Uridine kinase-like protein 5 [Sesamum calycinum]|uniref:uridine/cytidine kinase n=1 Tax=Sesamum calycinum TaxID=2727403 RepID=A0AAW2MN21_9LAMI
MRHKAPLAPRQAAVCIALLARSCGPSPLPGDFSQVPGQKPATVHLYWTAGQVIAPSLFSPKLPDTSGKVDETFPSWINSTDSTMANHKNRRRSLHCMPVVRARRLARPLTVARERMPQASGVMFRITNHSSMEHTCSSEAFDTELLLSCIAKLRQGGAVSIPNYDFKTHKSIEPARMVNPSDVIILEGILVLHDSRVRDLMNMKIFVDTDSDVRLARRIQRDTVERGRNVENVLDQYAKFVKPSFEEFILPTKKHADIIIPRGADNDVAIDLIVQHIRTKLGQHDLCKIYPIFFYTIDIPDRLIRLVVEHGLGHLPFTEKQITTPTGSIYCGVVFCKRLCGVSVIRSGESMENALRACCKGIKIGKILIHGEGKHGRQLIYEKLPSDIASRHVLLLDPVLASGMPLTRSQINRIHNDPCPINSCTMIRNSAVKAISVLLSKGVPESNIIFLNLIASPQGIHAVCKKFPRLKIVTSEIDTTLNKEMQVLPAWASLVIAILELAMLNKNS